MSFDKPDPVTPPDPMKTTQAQWDFTKNALGYTSGLNAPNIYSPFGNVTYDKDASGAVTGQHINLDPAQQQLLDSQRGLANTFTNKASSMMGQLPQGQFSLDQVGAKLPGVNDYGQYGNQIAQTSFNEARGLLDPVFQQQNRDLTQSLADRGQPVAGEGAGLETGRMRDAQNRAYTSAANNALLNAGNEMSRINSMENQNYGTALNAKLTERGLPQQELQGLLGLAGSQAAPYQQAPGINALNAQAPDYQGAVNTQYQGLLNNYNQEMGAYNNTWNTIGQVAGAGMKAAAMSSRSYKMDGAPASPVLDRVAGLDIERWKYRPEHADDREHIGPYAEDFKEAFNVGDGKTIAYVDMFGVLFKAVQELTAEVRALRAA